MDLLFYCFNWLLPLTTLKYSCILHIKIRINITFSCFVSGPIFKKLVRSNKMTDENQRPEREMHQGDWKCSECGASITELPFQPDPEREDTLLCRDCHRAKRQESRPDRGDRRMFEGDWDCAKCGAKITQLPFNPTNTDNLLCRDCHRAQREG